MDRAVLSQRISSILSDISRLTNALYAMNTTDIQRYPDNYEVLSTDAALRAERVACRLRHLLYATTTVTKEEYLTSAAVMQGIEITKPIAEVNRRCVEGGLLVIQAEGNVIRFVPPLIVEEKHIDEMIEKLKQALAE